MKRNIINISLIAVVTMAFMVISCGSGNEDGTIAYAEQNVEVRPIPVRVMEVKLQEFAKMLDYNATLEGAIQSEARSNVDGVLKNISVRTGQYVKKDAIIASFDEDLPASGFIQAKSAFEIAKTTYERMQNLYDAGGISRQQLDESETQYNISRANYDSAIKNVNILAPISGIVSNISARAGDNLYKGEPVATIADLSSLNAKIFVGEQDIDGFYEGLEVDISTNSMKHEAKGTVKKVAMSADPQRRAFEVEVSVDNSGNTYKPGMLVDVHALINRIENAVVIPKLIIQSDTGGDFIFIVKDQKAVKRIIKTGMESRGMIHVESGLSPGDLLVTEGQFSLYDQAPVAFAD